MNALLHAPPDLPRRALRLRDATLRLFANVLFAVSLLCAWGVLTLIGVVVPQERGAAWYFENYAAPTARLVTRLGLDTIYHGPAYLGVIGLILASLAVCTFKRVIPARMPARRPVEVERLPLNAAIDLGPDEAAGRARFDGFLAARGWSVRRAGHDGVEWHFADRHDWARRGVLVAHIGFVILAAGTCVYWASGFSGRTQALVGGVAAIPRIGATLRVEAFRARIDPIPSRDGVVYQPVDYVSDLVVTDREGRVRRERLRVNHPIDVDGTLVYQAAYGTAMRFDVRRGGATTAVGPLLEGQSLTLPGTERTLRYTRFVGTIGPGGSIGADPRPNRPGALVDVFDGGTPVAEALVPLGGRLDAGGGFSVAPAALTAYTGFDYRYDPGIPIVGVGAFVMLAGFCICLYVVPARLHARFARAEGGAWRVHVAATTVKGHDLFEDQFAALLAALARQEHASA